MNESKIHIYQLLVRLFGNKITSNQPNGAIETNGCGKFNDISELALEEIQNLGISHVWYTGIIEHASTTAYPEANISGDPSCILKGKAGSPYAIRDYYDVCPDLAENVPGRMKEFEELVKRTHKAGLKAIIDFIPNHVSRNYQSDQCPEGEIDFGVNDHKDLPFHPHNNYYYMPFDHLHLPVDCNFVENPAKATGNDCFHASPEITDWYETVKLNYGVDYMNGGTRFFSPVPDTWKKMYRILKFWANKNVDGFRCDMAEMVPVEFWGWVIPQIKKINPEIVFIAEVYNPLAYRDYIEIGDFDYLYDKVGMYDTVRAILEGKQSASAITAEWQKNNDILKHMLYFVENHDEQRLASRFFARDTEGGIPATILLTCLNQCPYLLYFGQEVGEKGEDEEGFSGMDGRTTIFDYWGIKSVQQWMNDGKFDGAQLNEQQKKLRSTYQNIMSFALNNPAISKGEFYDLQYANYENPEFDGNKLFAFMRYTENEKILFVLNFSPKNISFKINIPEHALETANWDAKDTVHCITMDFVQKEKTLQASLNEIVSQSIPIKANSGLAYRFTK